MSEDSPLDGSELEQIQEPQEQAAETPEVQEQAPQTATADTPPKPETPNIPEQFKNYTVEQMVNEWNKVNSQLGRYRQELTNAQQREQAYAAYLQQNGQNRQQPQNPSSLPGQEARQGQEKVDFWENPESVISNIVNQGIQSYEQKQIARQQMAEQQRIAAINSIGKQELDLIRLEADDYSPQLEALVRALDATDPEIDKLTKNPNVTEQEIRQAVRGLYDKASKMLSGHVDPAKLKAFNQATKQAAMNGAPNPTAGLPSTPSQYGDVPEDVKDRWGFLLDGN